MEKLSIYKRSYQNTKEPDYRHRIKKHVTSEWHPFFFKRGKDQHRELGCLSYIADGIDGRQLTGINVGNLIDDVFMWNKKKKLNDKYEKFHMSCYSLFHLCFY